MQNTWLAAGGWGGWEPVLCLHLARSNGQPNVILARVCWIQGQSPAAGASYYGVPVLFLHGRPSLVRYQPPAFRVRRGSV